MRLVAAETETGQLASDAPEPPTESPTTEGMAKPGLRKPQAEFATVTSRSPTLYAKWDSLKVKPSRYEHVIQLSPLPETPALLAAPRAKVSSAGKQTGATAFGENTAGPGCIEISLERIWKLTLDTEDRWGHAVDKPRDES